MRLPIFQVDAFTDKPFAGNPAAVCVLPEPREARWMQGVAQEMSLSETAFVLRQSEGFNLRWFTPTVEVDLCGHATLASAHILWEAGYLPPERPARFSTRSGLLTATRHGGWIEMDFPAEPETPTAAPPSLAGTLGVVPAYVGKNRFDYLVEVDSEESVRGLTPDFDALSRIPARGFIVTSRASSPGFDFVSRFFAPAAGIREDPVTGSAHCCLGPFWGPRLAKRDLTAYQASSRGGVVRVLLNGPRVQLFGQAVTVLRGELVRRTSRRLPFFPVLTRWGFSDILPLDVPATAHLLSPQPVPARSREAPGAHRKEETDATLHRTRVVHRSGYPGHQELHQAGRPRQKDRGEAQGRDPGHPLDHGPV